MNSKEYDESDMEYPGYWLRGSSIFLLLTSVGSLIAILGNLLSDLTGLQSKTFLYSFWQSFNVLSFYLPTLLFVASQALVRPHWLHAFGLLSFGVLPIVTLNGIVQVLLATPSNFNLWLNQHISPQASFWSLAALLAVQVLFLLHPAFRNLLVHFSKLAFQSFQEVEQYPQEDLEQLSPPTSRGIQPPYVPEVQLDAPAPLGTTNSQQYTVGNKQRNWNDMTASLEMEPPLHNALDTPVDRTLEDREPALPELRSFDNEFVREANAEDSFDDMPKFNYDFNALKNDLVMGQIRGLDKQESLYSQDSEIKEAVEESEDDDNPFEFAIDPIPGESNNQANIKLGIHRSEEALGDIRDPGFDILNTNADVDSTLEEREQIATSEFDPVQILFDQANLERPPFFDDGKTLRKNIKELNSESAAIERNKALDPKEQYIEKIALQKDIVRQEKILLRIQETDGELVDEDMADELLQQEKVLGDWREDYSKPLISPVSLDEEIPDETDEMDRTNDSLDSEEHERLDKRPQNDSPTPLSLEEESEEELQSEVPERNPLYVEPVAVAATTEFEPTPSSEILASEIPELPDEYYKLQQPNAKDDELESEMEKSQTLRENDPAFQDVLAKYIFLEPPNLNESIDWLEEELLEEELKEESEDSSSGETIGENLKEKIPFLDEATDTEFSEVIEPVLCERQEEVPLHEFDDVIDEIDGSLESDSLTIALSDDSVSGFPLDDLAQPSPEREYEEFSVAQAAEEALRTKEEREALEEEERGQKILAPPVQKSWQVYQVAMNKLMDYDSAAEERNAQIDSETEEAGQALLQTLRKFKIEAEMTHILKGPSITEFGILPASGIKLNRVEQLADNLAMELAARSIRIVAPIPGKKAVGIEIPNRRRSTVSFPALMDSEAMQQARRKMQLPIILGKEINGEVQIADLRRMPHLLIAGATGSGKSVCVNVIISSLILSCTPQQLRLLMIDPKIVELKQYNDIPHLLTPVIVDAQRALQALQWVSSEMERRYALLDAIGAGNKGIESYNRYIKEKNMATMPLEFIVVIIDEFADLMSLVGKDLEAMIARLAAMSRAVGIHLVLATQRPSVDVVTGLIKANFPTRIAFMVASQTDSRTILDQKGAEQLLGQGDMLFSFPGQSLIRAQGAYLSEEESEYISSYIKTLGQPAYLDEVIFEDEENENTHSLESGSDKLFPQAVEIAIQEEEISTSYLQRKLSIGYNRAAGIIDEMEERGIIGPPQGSKKRKVLQAFN